jgi:sporulation protein YlmC with PRC-barrel domain
MDPDKLKGMAVISMAEGTLLGRVEDVLFDPQALHAVALQVGSAGQTFAIPFEKIKNFGADAVTVDSGQVTQTISKGDSFSALPGLGAIKKLKVVDEAGTLLGTVNGIDIDGATGQMLNLSVHKGGVLGLGGTTMTVSVETIRGIGPELITVVTGAASSSPLPD